MFDGTQTNEFDRIVTGGGHAGAGAAQSLKGRVGLEGFRARRYEVIQRLAILVRWRRIRHGLFDVDSDSRS